MVARYNIELLGKRENKGSVMCPTNDPELASCTTLYVIFILVYSSSLYYLMIQNLKLHMYMPFGILYSVNL
jgi:hypothetical protein